MGEITLHGPHHSAQKSMTTNLPLLICKGIDQRIVRIHKCKEGNATISLNCCMLLMGVTVMVGMKKDGGRVEI
jgi:hypothetical protein